MRQVVLDTETTGLDPDSGHRLLEIGCLELINRRLTKRTLHLYINPDRAVDEGALAVHGITNDFLADKPKFDEVVDQILNFIRDAELIIHNAPFDVGFLNYELKRLGRAESIGDMCQILDTLPFARDKHPGQRNSLDALCKRYEVDNSGRDLHGALLDAELLARVYLKMTGGQIHLFASDDAKNKAVAQTVNAIQRLSSKRERLPVIEASSSEKDAHQKMLEMINDKAGNTLWRS